MESKQTERPPQSENVRPIPRNAFANLLMPVAFLAMATVCLWMGALMSVRCERIPAAADPQNPNRVSVTVERRLLGVIPISKTTLNDVVGVVAVHDPAAQIRRGSRGDIGAIFTLRRANGANWQSPPAYAPFGTPPWQMGWHIAKFIEDPAKPPLNLWCISWMLHLAATPLLLIGLFSAYFGVRSIWTGRSSAKKRPEGQPPP
ncbi:MAG TPA: hypothetical protein VFS35_00430, partial [Terrimicrobiaceae bacterium]|nr:hypothetical protein [Terrimicrobiaceae bacterium]